MNDLEKITFYRGMLEHLFSRAYSFELVLRQIDKHGKKPNSQVVRIADIERHLAYIKAPNEPEVPPKGLEAKYLESETFFKNLRTSCKFGQFVTDCTALTRIIFNSPQGGGAIRDEVKGSVSREFRSNEVTLMLNAFNLRLRLTRISPSNNNIKMDDVDRMRQDLLSMVQQIPSDQSTVVKELKTTLSARKPYRELVATDKLSRGEIQSAMDYNEGLLLAVACSLTLLLKRQESLDSLEMMPMDVEAQKAFSDRQNFLERGSRPSEAKTPAKKECMLHIALPALGIDPDLIQPSAYIGKGGKSGAQGRGVPANAGAVSA